MDTMDRILHLAKDSVVSDAWMISHLPPDTGVDEPPCAIVGVLRRPHVFEGIEAARYLRFITKTIINSNIKN